jgi:hypothetical protein
MKKTLATIALGVAALGRPSPAGAVRPAGARAAATGARYLVRVGEFVSPAGPTESDLSGTARAALLRSLSREARVVLSDAAEPSAEVQRTLRRRSLSGYTIDGRVRVVEGGGATRVEVSLLVQTLPGREYRFESAVTLTLSGAPDGARAQTLEDATRRAVGSATARCLGELGRQ